MSENSVYPYYVPSQQAEPIEIEAQDNILSVAFLVDREHIVGSGKGGSIRRWRVQDGREVGTPMNVGGAICDIAVSRDGKWVVNGTKSGEVTVWSAESDDMVKAFKAHNDLVYVVDVSPDGTRIATGSRDLTVCVWSFSSGERLLGPLKHTRPVVAVKFSPDQHLIATAMWRYDSVRVYGSQNGNLLFDVPIQVNSFNESLAWSSDVKQLFALSRSGKIECLDLSTGTVLAQWRIHSDDDPRCIALACNGTFIVASAKSSISFWDTTTHQQIGSLIQHPAPANSMAISTNYDLAIGGGEIITLRDLCDILPPHYTGDKMQLIRVENADLKKTIESLRVQEENSKTKIAHLEATLEQLSSSQSTAAEERDRLNETIDSLRVQEENSKTKIAGLEGTLEQLHHQLFDSQSTAVHEKDRLNETISSLCVQEDNSKTKITHLEEALEQLSKSQSTAAEERDCLNETIDSLRVQEENSKTNVTRLEETLEQLHHQLSDSQSTAAQEKDRLNETIDSLRVQEENSNAKIVHLEGTLKQLRHQLSDSQSTAAREEVRLNETIKFLSAQDPKSNSKIALFEATLKQLHNQFSDSQHTVDSLNETIESLRAREMHSNIEIVFPEQQVCTQCEILRAREQRAQYEVQYAEGNIMDRLADFKSQCVSSLEGLGDEALRAEKKDTAAAAYSMALSLGPSTPNTLLTKWAGVLIRSSVKEALSAAAKFGLSSLLIYQALCESFQGGGYILKAAECFRQMQSELGEQVQANSGDETEWVANFKVRCLQALEQRGDDAMDSASYNGAVDYYTTALTLESLSTNLLAKRSEARARIGSWQESLEDADEVIKLDPSSPRGYERKHAALLGDCRYDEAIDAYKDMLLKLEQSPDSVTQELRDHYVSPSQTMAAISDTVKQSQRDAPLILINTETGRLCNKEERLDDFEADQNFKKLVASITTKRDNSRILPTVQKYFRYATFSHTWEGAEPLFGDILRQSVHELTSPPTILKLVKFCTTVQEAGLRWAWSDTCCINRADGSVLNESLISMFRWYRKSSLTIIHLKGVRSESELGALVRCWWNTRAWTLQEFFASQVIRFYTDDWKLYLPHENVDNHKDSSVVMGEMAAATGVDVEVLRSLEPGPGNVRQKLCLAAARTATRPEDMAYSLFGIFDVSFQVAYGEGQQHALGRLLQEVLSRSGDVTILAWTGKASDYNSCLPAEIGVYRELASPFIPSPIEDGEMDALVAELRTDPAYLDSAVTVYDQLVHIPAPRLFHRRLSLPCIVFPLKGPLVSSPSSPNVYLATKTAFGSIEIKTMEDLSNRTNLVLVHPWLQYLLDPDLPSEDNEPLTPVDGDGEDDNFGAHRPPTPHTLSHAHDKLTRALRLFARLRQPFGALLLAPLSQKEYRRVASDHQIIVQLSRKVSLRSLQKKIRTVDIL